MAIIFCCKITLCIQGSNLWDKKKNFFSCSWAVKYPSNGPEDKDEKRKIQFSVPSSVPVQLDPRQVEMIRRRRPTPATLFRLTDAASPEEDSGQRQVRALGEKGVLKPKLVHMSTYQPPSLKGKSTFKLSNQPRTHTICRKIQQQNKFKKTPKTREERVDNKRSERSRVCKSACNCVIL
uniref:Protein phosphatase 1 regulatory subunit 1B n=1 Tax=Oryzias melastigma TaxID=30732 RepID=A0A3B3C806_ORYME